MRYPRNAERRLRRLSEMFPAVVTTGARQAGKTTLLRMAFPDHDYVSLDLPAVANQAERNPDMFLEAHPGPVVVDEVQYAPGLFRHLKAAIDRRRDEMGRYLLTGSQHFGLMRDVSDSLAGRCGMLELENLALSEIEALTPVGEAPLDLARFLVRGQFPELWRVPDIAARDFYAAYLATYLERDVRQILNVQSLRNFERFVRVLAARSATQIHKSNLASQVGVSVGTVANWLSVLETSGQIALLEPWHTNLGKRIAKTPRVYFRDTGLLCFLLNLDDPALLLRSPFLGAVWETFVFAELRKWNEAQGRPVHIWTYRDLGQREIDFVIERAGELSFVECKWEETPGPGEATTIRKVSADLEAKGGPWRAGSHCVVGRPRAAYDIAPGIRAIGVRDLPAVAGATGAG